MERAQVSGDQCSYSTPGSKSPGKHSQQETHTRAQSKSMVQRSVNKETGRETVGWARRQAGSLT